MIILLKVILTVATTLGTLILLILNNRANRISNQAVEAMRFAREEEYRPYVYYDVAFEDHEMHMVLKNSGKSAAYNVKLHLDQDIKIWNSLASEKDYKLQDMGMSKEVEMLAPGEEFKEWADVSFRFFQNNESKHLTGKVTYDDGAGRDFEFKIDLDLTPFAERVFSPEKGMEDLITLMDRMRMDLDRNW